MATAHKIVIGKENTGLLSVKQTDEAAAKVSELLQQDLDTHHVFFNDKGYHNHISHLLLALFGTGASPDLLATAFATNSTYQRPLATFSESVVQDLADWSTAKQYMGKEKHYVDFLEYYRRQIDALGWKECLQHVLFRATERSQEMFYLMFTGLLHPLIQLMYGLEWEQPALIAMGLAQAAMHNSRETPILREAEAQLSIPQDQSSTSRSIEHVYREAAPLMSRIYEKDFRLDRVAEGGAYYTFIKDLYDNHQDIFNAVAQMVPHIDTISLNERTAEMFYAIILNAAAPAIKVVTDFGKEPKYCFHVMHQVNSSPAFLTIIKSDWIPGEYKVRMLRLKILTGLWEFGARLFAPLDYGAVRAYQPKDGVLPKTEGEFLSRVGKVKDDGHCIKLARSLAICKNEAQKYSGSSWMKLSQEDFQRIAASIIDATLADIPKGTSIWIRGGGYLPNFEHSPSASWITTPVKPFEQWWPTTNIPDGLTRDASHSLDPELVKRRVDDLKKTHGKWPVNITNDWYI